ncbi:hypothetical protein HY407_02640 [Candidatus Gottesmanbacteria bacterium]|nr:hypothetical protein [Candidatus Gottesmanbacteria bacterium]
MTSNFTSQDIEIHIRKYRSLLKSSGSLHIDQLIDSHLEMKSILHLKGDQDEVDIASFIYCLLRLPSCTSSVGEIILGQSYSVFKNAGFAAIINWKEVSAPGRRRKMFYDAKKRLAVYIASVTDVDDIITLLTAFQIEWNKLHKKLANVKEPEKFVEKIISPEDLGRIKNIWGKDYYNFLQAIKNRRVSFTIKLLSGSYVEYAKSTSYWWKNITRNLHHLNIPKRPIYFVSSNTHSITNLLTRFATYEENELITYLYSLENPELIRFWEEIQSGDFLGSRENFLYYIAKKYAHTHPEILQKKESLERNLGIHTIPASRFLDIDTQVIELSRLSKDKTLGQKIGSSLSFLIRSKAIILNIDYPLGWAAYQILTTIGQNVDTVKGVYIMGKAATLNGQIGDILLPNTIYDHHTKNTYAFSNAFSAKDFTTIFKTGNVLDHQKSISTKGTFLENAEMVKNWFDAGYTIIEMEGGPYLNAVYEFVHYDRYEENQFVSLTNPPFELGIAHYASDTPYSKAKNLGVRNLSYEGVEPTYAISLAILKKIIQREKSS